MKEESSIYSYDVPTKGYQGPRDQNSLRTGTGDEKWDASFHQRYSGQFFQDTLHGRGRYLWSFNSKQTLYDGLFHASTLEGYGRFMYDDSSSFEGLYKNSARFGPGVFTYQDGNQDVGIWNGENLIRLCQEVLPEWVPRIAMTPLAKTILLRYKKLVHVCSQPENRAQEVLEALGANKRVLAYSTKLYNIHVRNPESHFFNTCLYQEEYFCKNDCYIEVALKPEAGSRQDILDYLGSLQEDAPEEELPACLCQNSAQVRNEWLKTEIERLEQLLTEADLELELAADLEQRLKRKRTKRSTLCKNIGWMGVEGTYSEISAQFSLLDMRKNYSDVGTEVVVEEEYLLNGGENKEKHKRDKENYARGKEEHGRSKEGDEGDKEKYEGGKEDHEGGKEDHERGKEDYKRGKEDHERSKEDHERGKEDHEKGKEEHEGGKEEHERGKEEHKGSKEKHEVDKEEHAGREEEYEADDFDDEDKEIDYEAACRRLETALDIQQKLSKRKKQLEDKLTTPKFIDGASEPDNASLEDPETTIPFGQTRLPTKLVLITDLLAWNNEQTSIEIMKHVFLHRNFESDMSYSVPDLLVGNRKSFNKSGKYEDNCITFLKECSHGNARDVLELFWKTDLYPDLCDARGNTGVIYAAARDRVKVIRLLVNLGANLDVCNDENLTPLSICLARYLAAQLRITNWEKAFLKATSVEPEEAQEVLVWRPHESITSLTELSRTKLDTSEKSFMWSSEALSEYLKSSMDVIRGAEALDAHERFKRGRSFQNEQQEHYKSGKDDLGQLYVFGLECVIPPAPKKSKSGKGKKEKKAGKARKSDKSSKKSGKSSKRSKKISEKSGKSSKKSNKSKKSGKSGKSEKKSAQSTSEPGHLPEELALNRRLDAIHNTIVTLLDFGASPNIGEVPLPNLTISIFTKNACIVSDLLKSKADPNVRTIPDGLTPLHVLVSLAPSPELVDILKVLLQNGADPNLKADPNHWADEKKKLLGSCTTIEDDEGKTPLHLLCMRYDFILDPSDFLVHMVGVLMENGARVKERYLGHTPLSLAVLRGNIRLMEALLVTNQVNPNELLGENLGVPLTVLVLKRYRDVLPVEKCMEVFQTLLKHKANPFHDTQVYGNSVDFMIKEQDVPSKLVGAGKSKKGSKKSSKQKSKSSKSSKRGKKNKSSSQEDVKQLLVDLSKNVLQRHVKGRAVNYLYFFVQEEDYYDDISANIAKLVTPEETVQIAQLLVQRGLIPVEASNYETMYDLLEFVISINSNLKPSSKKAKNPPKRDIDTMLAEFTFTKAPRQRRKLDLPEPEAEPHCEKYDACLNCCRRKDRQLFLCPSCQLAYFCSQECNIRSNKSKNRFHQCGVVFYNKQKQNFEVRLKEGLDGDVEEMLPRLMLTSEKISGIRRSAVEANESRRLHLTRSLRRSLLGTDEGALRKLEQKLETGIKTRKSRDSSGLTRGSTDGSRSGHKPGGENGRSTKKRLGRNTNCKDFMEKTGYPRTSGHNPDGKNERSTKERLGRNTSSKVPMEETGNPRTSDHKPGDENGSSTKKRLKKNTNSEASIEEAGNPKTNSDKSRNPEPSFQKTGAELKCKGAQKKLQSELEAQSHKPNESLQLSSEFKIGKTKLRPENDQDQTMSNTTNIVKDDAKPGNVTKRASGVAGDVGQNGARQQRQRRSQSVDETELGRSERAKKHETKVRKASRGLAWVETEAPRGGNGRSDSEKLAPLDGASEKHSTAAAKFGGVARKAGATLENPEAATGWAKAATGWPKAATGRSEAATGWPKAATGRLEAATGWSEAATRWSEAAAKYSGAVTGWSETATGRSKPATGWSEAATGRSKAAARCSEAVTRLSEAATGRSKAVPGRSITVRQSGAGYLEATRPYAPIIGRPEAGPTQPDVQKCSPQDASNRIFGRTPSFPNPQASLINQRPSFPSWPQGNVHLNLDKGFTPMRSGGAADELRRRLPNKYQYFLEKISQLWPEFDLSLLFLPYACFSDGQLYYRFSNHRPVFMETHSNI